MKIAYITYSGTPSYTAAYNFSEVHDLIPFLQGKGLDIQPEIWDDPTVDWSRYQVALLKMPWDYHRKFEAFKQWLDHLESLHIRLLNNYDTVRWNFDKHYLQEIIASGLPVIPSIFMDRGWTGNLMDLFKQCGSEKIIIKPCVSGGSNNTHVLTKTYSPAQEELILALAGQTDLLAQPFVEEITEGEWSFLFLNGMYSHTILKKPKAGDFRVQQAYGGTIEPVFPEQQLIDTAAAYVAAFAGNTLYARVDGVLINSVFRLMELELIEPFLYLSYDPNAAERYYQAILQHLYY